MRHKWTQEYGGNGNIPVHMVGKVKGAKEKKVTVDNARKARGNGLRRRQFIVVRGRQARNKKGEVGYVGVSRVTALWPLTA